MIRIIVGWVGIDKVAFAPEVELHTRARVEILEHGRRVGAMMILDSREPFPHVDDALTSMLPLLPFPASPPVPPITSGSLAFATWCSS